MNRRIEAQTVSLQETDDNTMEGRTSVDRSDPEFSEADTFVGFEIQVTDKLEIPKSTFSG